MSTHAHVSSLEALESFRANLVTYLAAARPTVDDMTSEITATRIWLEQDRLLHWGRELKRRQRILVDAEALLFSARMAHLKKDTQAEMNAVRRAKQSVEEAEDRLRKIKKWLREFDSRISPLGRQLDSLRSLLTLDMSRATAALDQTIQFLADYSGVSSAPATPRSGEPPTPSEKPA